MARNLGQLSQDYIKEVTKISENHYPGQEGRTSAILSLGYRALAKAEIQAKGIKVWDFPIPYNPKPDYAKAGRDSEVSRRRISSDVDHELFDLRVRAEEFGHSFAQRLATYAKESVQEGEDWAELRGCVQRWFILWGLIEHAGESRSRLPRIWLDPALFFGGLQQRKVTESFLRGDQAREVARELEQVGRGGSPPVARGRNKRARSGGRPEQGEAAGEARQPAGGSD